MQKKGSFQFTSNKRLMSRHDIQHSKAQISIKHESNCLYILLLPYSQPSLSKKFQGVRIPTDLSLGQKEGGTWAKMPAATSVF
jgi:hypothetical protein